MCCPKIKRARTEYGQIYEKMRRSNQDNEAPMVGSSSSSSPGRVQGTACPVHETAHVSAVPCSYSSLWLSAPQIPYNRGSKAYINDERERDERSHSLMCLKGTRSLSESATGRSGWLHHIPQRAQCNQKWAVLGSIPRKARAFNSPFKKPLKIKMYINKHFFFLLCSLLQKKIAS